MIITFLIAKFAAWGLPEPIRRVAAWTTVIAAACAILWAAKAAYDASVVNDHERDKAITTIDALDRSAEDRAVDAIKNMIDEKEREDAIKSAPTGDALSDADLRLNCMRLKALGRVPEPCRRFSGN
jgi:hypothetical protein